MHRFLSVCTRPKVEKIIHISISIVARGMKFGQSMDVYDLKVDLEGQGQRSRSPGQKRNFGRLGKNHNR